MLIRNVSGRNQIIKLLLALVLVLAMFSQFALPAMADTCNTYVWYTGVSNANALKEITVMGHNTSQGFEISLPFWQWTYNGSYYCITYAVPNDGSAWYIHASMHTYVSGYGTDNIFTYNTSFWTPGSYMGDSPQTATDAANNAANQAINAANQAINAANQAINATNSANNATNSANNATNAANSAYTAANTAASNTTNDPAANTAITNTTNGMAATYNAAMAASNNIAPAISTILGQGGATCTAGSTFTANIAVSPSSSVTYTAVISGPGGSPGYTTSGNQITINTLTVSGAYTVTVTATYTPTGKACTYPFIFFKI